MKKSQRVVALIIAVLLVFNIGVMSASALSEAVVGFLWALGTAVATNLAGEGIHALFKDAVPSSQPTQNYYTVPVNPVSRPTIYNPQEFNTTTTTSTTNNTKIVNTYNKTITTINNTTNNYEIKNYETIYYNNEYNTYYTQIDNYNYYITYAPTYVNITYLDSHASSVGDAYSYNLYYQLPDGRNSFNLTANDVWGTVFLSDFVNYGELPEDDGQTLALYHFDGDIRDASAKNGSAEHEQGASINYVNSGSFDRALYWDNGTHCLNINMQDDIGTGDYTIELRIYTAKASNPNLSFLFNKIFNPPVINYNEITHMGKNRNIKEKQYVSDGSPSLHIRDENGIATGETWFGTSYTNLTDVTNFDAYKISKLIKSENTDILYYVYAANTLKTITQTSGSNNKYEWLIQGEVKKGIIDNVENLGIEDITNYSNNQWNAISIVRQNGNKTIYVNGVKGNTKTDDINIGNVLSILIDANMFDYMYIDELRVTNNALYTSNYTPSTMPYDTNLVFVLPSNGVEDRIAIKSNIEVSNSRIGGVRPTYPTNGYVYISLDTANKVESIQQYNGADWISVDAAIYKNGTWNNLDKYDMASYMLDEDDFPNYEDAHIIGKNNVVYMLTNLNVNSGVSTIANGETFHMTLMPDDGFVLPETIQVVMGMEELLQGTDFTYSGGEITIPSVTGDVYIAAAGTTENEALHSISYSLTNMNLKNQQRSESGFTAEFEVAEKFVMPSSIKVIMGDTELSPTTGYTYSNGVLTVPSIIDDVLVVALAKVNESAIPPTPTPTPTPGPGGDDGGISGLWEFLEDIINFIIDGIDSLIATITNLLAALQNFGSGFVEFLTASFAFIPTEITTMLALGVGLMIVLAVIKFFKG